MPCMEGVLVFCDAATWDEISCIECLSGGVKEEKYLVLSF